MGPNSYPSGIIQPSAAYIAATYNSNDIRRGGAFGVRVNINVTNANGGTLTVKIQGKDPASGAYYDILTSAGLAGNAMTNLMIYPGATAGSLAVNVIVPDEFRISAAVVGATMTYSIGAELVVHGFLV